jgi:photosystem II stability/assembly factor-like uncharacterized protein
MRARTVLAGALATLGFAGLTGCGSEDAGTGAQEPTQETGSALVDPATTPYVNALERRPGGGFLLTTNRGFFEVDADGRRATQVRDAKVVTDQGTSPVGTFLELADLGDGTLLGSGHPDDAEALPQYLGILRSRDQGRTWRVVDRLGTADVHVVRRVGDTFFMWDAVLGAVLITKDLERFEERFTPRSLVLDLEVDPADTDRLLITTEDELYRSTDQGRSWRAIERVKAARLSWTAGGALFRATQEGAWQRSADRGESWQDVGRLPGEPWKVLSSSASEHHVALADGSIARTTDGGRTWSTFFRAPRS